MSNIASHDIRAADESEGHSARWWRETSRMVRAGMRQFDEKRKQHRKGPRVIRFGKRAQEEDEEAGND